MLKKLKDIIILPFAFVLWIIGSILLILQERSEKPNRLYKILKTHKDLIIAVVLGNLLCIAILGVFMGGVQLVYYIATKLLGM